MRRTAFVTQTTLSVDDTACIVQALRTRFPGLKRREETSATPPRTGRTGEDLIGHCDVLVVWFEIDSNSNRFGANGRQGRHTGSRGRTRVSAPRMFDGPKTSGDRRRLAPEILCKLITQLKRGRSGQ